MPAVRTYKQYDSRWGSRNYNGSSNMAQGGCGPTSCAMLAYAVDGKTTPFDTMQYMQKHGYAIPNNGTAWDGIPACLKAFGLQDVREVSDMSKVWEYLNKGYYAIFLMTYKDHKSNKVTWTTSGHYITISAYKYQDKKHKVWVRDPGGRNLDSDAYGWFNYEDHMQGWIKKVWVCITPEKAKKLSKKKVTKCEKLYKMAKKCAWPKGTPKSKRAYPKGKPTKEYKNALKKAYPKRKWSRQCRKGASCDVAAGVVIRASGVDKNFPRGLSEQVPHLKKSKKWVRVKVTKRSQIKKGWVVYQHRKSGSKHIVIAMGNGNAYNAHYYGKSYPVIEKLTSVVRPASKCKVFKVSE